MHLTDQPRAAPSSLVWRDLLETEELGDGAL
jgi:hypothetical protein